MNNTLLQEIRYVRTGGSGGYPFSVASISTLDRLELSAPVTFFAGGNGTGKSSLLEAIAISTKRIAVSTADYAAFPSGIHELADALKLRWALPRNTSGKDRSRGFFLRAEDFLDYKRGVVSEIQALRGTATEYAGHLSGYGLDLAQAAVLGQANAMTRRYGEDLDAMSHGESFLQFFRARFTGPGLYLLDEPDTALSPQSVLGLMSALGEMVAAGAQFIIATHNPVLLTFPGALILDFDHAPVAVTAWEELEQVRLLRDFLAQPSAFLRHLGLPEPH